MTKFRGFMDNIGGLVTILLVFVISAATIPTVANTVSQVTTNSGVAGYTAQNVTGGALAMAQLLTLLFVAVVVVTIVQFLQG